MPRTALALVEPSFDSLFAATIHPTVIIDAQGGSVVSANAAAARLLGIPRSALAGMPLPALLEARSAADFRTALELAREQGAAGIDAVRFRDHDADLTVRLSLVRSGASSYVLTHLGGTGVESATRSLVYDAIDSGAMLLVVTDSQLNLLYANRACLRLFDVGTLREVFCQPLSRWITIAASDRERLQAQMHAREMAIVVSGMLIARRCALHALAIAVPDEGRSLWAFLLTETSLIN